MLIWLVRWDKGGDFLLASQIVKISTTTKNHPEVASLSSALTQRRYKISFIKRLAASVFSKHSELVVVDSYPNSLPANSQVVGRRVARRGAGGRRRRGVHRVVRVHLREAHVVRRVRGVDQAPQRLLLLLSRILGVSVVQVAAALLLLLLTLRRQEGLVVVRQLQRERSLSRS